MSAISPCPPRSVVRAAALTVLALIALVLVRADPASAYTSGVGPCAPAADIVAPSCMEAGDGNQTREGSSTTRLDWAQIASAADLVTITDDQASTFATGSKEQAPGTWELDTSAETGAPKVDAVNAAFVAEPVSGHLFFYGAFKRRETNAQNVGDANVSFELNATPGLFDNDGDPATPEVPIRSDGDVLIAFDGTGNNPRVGMCKWHGDEYGEFEPTPLTPDPQRSTYGWYTLPGFGGVGAVKLKANDDTTPGAVKQCTTISNATDHTARSALGATNTADVANFIAQWSDTTLQQARFGEVAVDLTEALATLATPSPCINFGSVWLHSRASSEATANMEDYLAPRAIQGARTCAIDVDKQVKIESGSFRQGTTADPSVAQPGEDDLTFRIVVTNPGQVPLTGVTVDDDECSPNPPTLVSQTQGTTSVTPGSDTTLDPGDVWTYECTHRLTTSDGDSYTNTADVSGSPGVGATPVTDTDSTVTSRKAGLVVEKDVVGNRGDDTFDLLVGTTVVKQNAVDGDASSQQVLDPGAYTVSEAPGTTPTGTNLGEYRKSVVCRDRDGAGQVVAQTSAADDGDLNVTLAAGIQLRCVISNTREQGTLQVVKAVPDGRGDDTFSLRVDGTEVEKVPTTTGSLAGPVQTVDTGLYDIAEVAGDAGTSLGDYLKSVSCVDQDGAVAASTGDTGSLDDVPVQFGDAVVCTITNRLRQGSVAIKKVTDPDPDPANPDQGFVFQAPSGLQDVTVTNGQTSTAQSVSPGTYTFTEDDLAAWEATSVQCSDSGQTTAGDRSSGQTSGLPAGQDASVTFDVQPGEHVVCTVTNRLRRGSVAIKKLTDPSTSTQEFDFTAKSVGVTNIADLGHHETSTPQSVLPGTYEFTEDQVAGWDLTAIACSDADQADAADRSSGVTAPPNTSTTEAGTITFDVQPGEDVVCTVTNTQDATVVVEKQTDPDETNGTTFGFATTARSPGTFSLQDDGTETRSVVPGSYTVSEDAIAGYALTSIVCDDQDADPDKSTGDTSTRTATYRLRAGERVKCTFTNTAAPADISVRKVTRSQAGVAFEDDQPFTFAVTGGGVNQSPTLDTDSRTALPQQAGPYSVSQFGDKVHVRETQVPLHWRLADIACTGTQSANVRYGTLNGATFDQGATAGFDPGDTTAEVDVQTAESVLCTFTNVADEAHVQVRKRTTEGGRPVASAGPFTVTLDGSGIHAREDVDTEPSTARPDVTRRYSTDDEFHETYVTESSLPAGWSIADISCVGDRVRFGTGVGKHFDPGPTDGFDPGDTVARVDLDPGDDVLCTFTNDRRPDPPALVVEPQQQPQQQAAPALQVVASTQPQKAFRPAARRAPRRPGSARLIAPGGCRNGAFRVQVAGRQIEKVVFFLDGRRLRTVRASHAKRLPVRASQGRTPAFTIRIDPRRLSHGRVHRVRAKAYFTAASGTHPRNLRAGFVRCARRTVAPRFTG